MEKSFLITEYIPKNSENVVMSCEGEEEDNTVEESNPIALEVNDEAVGQVSIARVTHNANHEGEYMEWALSGKVT